MLGGRPLQDIAAELHSDGTSWTRAPAGISRARRDAGVAERRRCGGRAARRLQGRAQRRILRSRCADDRGCRAAAISPQRSQKPLRLRGDVTVAPDGFAIDAMKAEIDGGAVEGRVAVRIAAPAAVAGRCGIEGGAARSRRRDRLRALAGRAASRMAGRGTALARHRPRHLGRAGAAAAAGKDSATGRRSFSLERLKIGQPDNVTLEGAAISTAPMPPANWRSIPARRRSTS